MKSFGATLLVVAVGLAIGGFLFDPSLPLPGFPDWTFRSILTPGGTVNLDLEVFRIVIFISAATSAICGVVLVAAGKVITALRSEANTRSN